VIWLELADGSLRVGREPQRLSVERLLEERARKARVAESFTALVAANLCVIASSSAVA
jgi:nicotinamide mononucleotide (NMN) deamidase PncC